MRRSLKLNKQRGSITLEAAVIMPVFISFLLFLITMVRIALVDLALYQMVTESSKQAAAQMYLVQLTYDHIQDTPIGEWLERVGGQKETIENTRRSTEQRFKNMDVVINQFEHILPDEIVQLLRMSGESSDPLVGAYHRTLGQLFKPYVTQFADQRVLDIEQLYITKVVFPNLKELDQPYVGFEIRYDLPLYLPFLDYTLSFQHQAYERVWIGEYYKSNLVSENPSLSDPFEEENDEERDEGDEKVFLRIHSISSPVQRGRSVRIIAKGPPHSTATISLYYQSGFEKDASCSSDASGWFHCDIRIGGNSKEGEFEAFMQVGEAKDRGVFTVLSKDNMR